MEDKIVLKGSLEAEKLLMWGHYYVENLVDITPTNDKGTLMLLKDSTTHNMVEGVEITFKREEKKISFQMILTGGVFKQHKTMDFSYDLETGNIIMSSNTEKIKQSAGTMDFVFKAVQLYFSAMTFLHFHKEDKRFVEVKRNSISRKVKRKGKKDYVTRKLLGMTYTLEIPEWKENDETTEYLYQRHMSNLYIKGYWRTYQTGRSTWIKPRLKSKHADKLSS